VAVIAFTFGCISAFDRPTRGALVPLLVPREDLVNAIALSSAVWEGSAILGPVLAGVIIAFGGLSVPFFLTAAGFLVYFIALFWTKAQSQNNAATADRGIFSDITDGLSYIRSNSLFVSLISMAFFNALFGLSFVVLMPVFALETLDVGSQGLGALFTALGAGTFVGVMFVASLGDISRRGGLLVVGGACVFGCLLIVFSFSHWITLSIALLVVIGTVRAIYTASLQTLLQLLVEDRYRGRVTGIYSLQWSIGPMGGLWGGVVTDLWGAAAAVIIGGTAVALFSLLVGLREPGFRAPPQTAFARQTSS
jgi:predicted MFS family arabinose efflux permease